MYLRVQLFFFCFMSEFGREECSQLSKNDHFFVQLAAQVLFPKFLSKEGVVYVRSAWNDEMHGVALPVDFNLLCVLFQELEVVKILLFQIFIAFWAFSLKFRVGWGFICAKYDWLGQNFPSCFCFDAFMFLYILEIF